MWIEYYTLCISISNVYDIKHRNRVSWRLDLLYITHTYVLYSYFITTIIHICTLYTNAWLTTIEILLLFVTFTKLMLVGKSRNISLSLIVRLNSSSQKFCQEISFYWMPQSCCWSVFSREFDKSPWEGHSHSAGV